MREWQKIVVGVAAVTLLPTLPAVLSEARWYFAANGNVEAEAAGRPSQYARNDHLNADRGTSTQIQSPIEHSAASKSDGKEDDRWQETGLLSAPGFQAIAGVLQAVFAAILVCTTIRQLKIISHQGKIMECQSRLSSDALEATRDMANSTRKAAEATARALFKDRAYIFIDYITHTWPEPILIPPNQDVAHYQTTVRYKITNYGSTPAVITKIESHGFLKNRYLDDPELRTPDPRSQHDIKTYGSRQPQCPYIIETGDYFGDYNAPQQVILRGDGESYTVEHEMSFQNRRHDPTRKIHHLWIYCVVNYEDIYMNAQTTSYYAAAGGRAGAFRTDDSAHNFRT